MRGSLALILLCLAAGAASAQSTECYTLSGQVVDYATGQPLPNMRVSISSYPSWQLTADPVTSGPDGKFIFYGLQAGLYLADTWLNGEIVHYREMPHGTFGATRVGLGFEHAEFTFRVALHPSIEGTVRDEFGDPAPHATVIAFRSVWNDGRVVRARQVPATADDQGHYRISALPPGAYVVCAEFADLSGSDWFRTIAPERESSVDFAAREAPRLIRRSCYPGDPPASFKIEWGKDVHVDLKLGSTSGTKIQGRVTNTSTPALAAVRLIPEDDTVSSLTVRVQPDGAFEATVLEPGRYVVEARSGAVVARQTVVADKTPVTGLQLAMQPVGTIPIFVQGPAAPAPQPGSVSIGLRSVSSASDATWWAQSVNGSFSIPSIDPGKYSVVTRTEDPFCVESVTFGGRAVLHDTVTVAAGESGRLDVVLSTRCATIEGKVILPERGDTFPVIAVMMSGTAKSPGDVFTTESDEDGTFSIGNLPPGRYSLCAWSQSDTGYAGPDSLTEVANQASVVEVGTGQHAAIQLRTLSPLAGAK